MDLGNHFRVIAQNWWRILLVSLLVGGGVYFLTARRPSVYEAGSLLTVTAGHTTDIGSVPAQTAFLTENYAERATTPPVLLAATQSSGLDISVGEAASRVSATPSSAVGFLTVSSSGPAPRDASKLANADAEALIADVETQQQRQVKADLVQVNAEIDQLAQQLNGLAADSPDRVAIEARYSALLQAAVDRRTQPRDRVEVVSRASPPTAPSSPRPLRDAALGFLVALVITAELSVVRHMLGDRLPRNASPERIGRTLGLPVLAAVPNGPSGSGDVVEASRMLRTSLVTLGLSRSLRSLLITSATPDAGKSFTAINLAQSFTANDTHVVLVDADLRRPVIHQRLDIDRSPGLSDVLKGASPVGTLYSVGLSEGYAVDHAPRFLVLPSGGSVPDPVALLGADATRKIEQALASAMDGARADCIIIDTPPTRLFADALTLSAQCDVTLIVVDMQKSRLGEVRDTITSLQRSGANVVGIVLNRVAVSRAVKAYRS